MNPCVSVVVPTYKRPDLLERCLTALLDQDVCPTAYEVIVVDDAACDETRARVCCLARRATVCGHVVRYLPLTCAHGPAAARNAGWRSARGEIIAFTDDDCVPDRGWLRAGMAAFVDGVVGVSGRLRVPLPEPPTDYELNVWQLQHATFITANCFYRRGTLAAVGGFDERFPLAWREDSDLHFRLLRETGRLVMAPDALVVHPIRPAPWGVSLRQQRKSMFNALLYKKHPKLYREHIQRTPPWPYYWSVGALLVAVCSLARRHGLCAAAGICMWLLLTGQFCLHRLNRTTHTPSHVAEMVVTSALIPPLSVYWRLRGAVKFRVFFL